MDMTNTKSKILIVDDEPLNVKLLAAMIPSDQYDTVRAYSGEEFAVVLSNTCLKEAVEIAERIRRSIQEYSFETENFSTTVSIGISVYPLDANSMNELIEKSDNSLYKAKHDGKNRVYAYSKKKLPS
jgi:diguanylate cyclase (GGDEF)-like protein